MLFRSLRAVLLPAVAATAHVEHRPARFGPAQPLAENDFLGARDRPRTAGLDTGPPSWKARPTQRCAASLRGHTQNPGRPPKTTGVSFLTPAARSLPPHEGRACGADDDESLPRQSENSSSRRAPTFVPEACGKNVTLRRKDCNRIYGLSGGAQDAPGHDGKRTGGANRMSGFLGHACFRLFRLQVRPREPSRDTCLQPWLYGDRKSVV